MDRAIPPRAAAQARRRIQAAWEALERAEALLPPGHPAVWHLKRALAAVEADWRAHHAAPDAPGGADTPPHP